MFSLKQILFCFCFVFVTGLISFFAINQQNITKGFVFKKKVYKPIIIPKEFGKKNDHLITNGLPGQPSEIQFKQYAGYVTVDEIKGRSLFYYFVEADGLEPSARPLILWLNGGPGCSSFGNGAFLENGPFRVHSDGRTLYQRRFSWNKVANILYLESPAGVGFSYSNTTSDYTSPGDFITAQDSFIFLLKWFQMFSIYKNNDFYIAGESYAGFYVPELSTVIVQHNHHAELSSKIRLKGVMIGNGFMNPKTDFRGLYDYFWSHALISDETHRGLIKYCIESTSSKCLLFWSKVTHEMGKTNVYNLYSDYCSPNSSSSNEKPNGIDACENNYVTSYLNRPEVQRSLHANITKLPYSWSLCSSVIQGWGDRQTTMFPLYRKLIAARLHVLVYSGDVEAVVPVTGTRYSINAMNLRIKTSWKPWYDDTQQVAGFRVEYDGLTFMTVLGAGHEVPRYQPRKAFFLLKFFLEGM